MAKNTVEITVELDDLVSGDVKKMRAQVVKNNKKMESSFKKLKTQSASTFSSIKSSVTSLKGAFIGLAGALAIGKINSMIKEVAGLGDSLDKVSSKLGINVERLQELQFAAGQSGVPIQSLNVGLQRFIRRAAEAASGTGEAKAALQELGIQLKDNNGNLRPATELLKDVADGFQGMGSQADRVRIAFKLFDTEGVGLVNLLQGGSKAIEDFAAEAQRLGIVIDKDSIQATVEYTDALDKFNKVITGLKVRALLPVMQELTKVFESTSTAAGESSNKVANLGDGMRSLFQLARATWNVFQFGADVISFVGSVIMVKFLLDIQNLITAFGTLGKTAKQVFTGDFKGAVETAKAGAIEFKDNWVFAGKNVMNLWDDLVERSKINAKDIANTFADVPKSIDKETPGGGGGGGGGGITPAQQAALDQQAALQNELNILSKEGQDRELEQLTQWYLDKSAIAEGNAELEKELLDVSLKQQSDIEKKWNGIRIQKEKDFAIKKHNIEKNIFNNAATLAGNLMEIGKETLEGNKKAGGILKTFAIAEIIINTSRAIMAAMAPPPLGAGPILGPIFAASAAVLGGVQAGKVAATQFQRGGIVEGSGGADSVPAAVSPGEAIFTRSQQRQLFSLASGRGGGGSTNVNFEAPIINVQGGDPNEIGAIVAETYQEQIQKFSEMQRDSAVHQVTP